MKLSLSKEFKVGTLTVLCLSILYFGFNYLKGVNTFSSTHHFYVIYNNIEGLQEGNQVMINGFSVGRVNNISLLKRINDPVLIEIEITKDINLNTNSVAELKDASLLGAKFINLIINIGEEYLSEGDTLLSRAPMGLTEKISERIIDITDSLDITKHHLNKLLKTYITFGDSIGKTISKLSNSLQSIERNINSTLENATVMMKNTQESLKIVVEEAIQIGDTIQKMHLIGLSKELEKTAMKLNQSIEAINQKKGTLGKMVYDDELYANLNQAVMHLDSLFADLQKNPKRYVHFSIFGRKD